MTEEKVPKQEQSIELLSFDPIVCLRDVLRRWYVIAALALIAALGAYAGSEATYTPRYTTTTTFVVTMQDSSSSVYQNLSATSNLAAVFSEILNSSVLRKTVVETLGIPAFHGSIEASAVARRTCSPCASQTVTPAPPFSLQTPSSTATQLSPSRSSATRFWRCFKAPPCLPHRPTR